MSPIDFWAVRGGFLRSSTCSCKLALLAMWGVVGGGSGGGGGGGGWTALFPLDRHGSKKFFTLCLEHLHLICYCKLYY